LIFDTGVSRRPHGIYRWRSVRYKIAIPKQTLHEKEVINLKDGGRRKEGVPHFL
jgi:hypothetical protein